MESYSAILLPAWNYVFCNKMDTAESYYAKWLKPVQKRENKCFLYQKMYEDEQIFFWLIAVVTVLAFIHVEQWSFYCLLNIFLNGALSVWIQNRLKLCFYNTQRKKEGRRTRVERQMEGGSLVIVKLHMKYVLFIIKIF